jgi:IS66 Orf2 like protein
MIPIPSGVRVWLAVGHTDMRRGMNSLALQIQEKLGRDPHAMLSSDEKATHYHQQTTRLRNIVALSRSDAKLERQLIDLASQYERLAQRAVGLQRPQEAGSPAAKAAPRKTLF